MNNGFTPSIFIGSETIETAKAKSDEIHQILTDEDAESALPGHPMALKRYLFYRDTGNTPHMAFARAIEEWREFWHAGAYVPHLQ